MTKVGRTNTITIVSDPDAKSATAEGKLERKRTVQEMLLNEGIELSKVLEEEEVLSGDEEKSDDEEEANDKTSVSIQI